MAIIDETKRDLLYESNDQESRPRPRSKPMKKPPPRAPRLLLLEEAAVVPCLSRPSFFPSFSPTAGREEKDEEKDEEEEEEEKEVAEEGDSQQDRRTRYAAKAWSVDKIASS